MDVKKKILFIVPSLRAGGSERVILYLVNNLDRRKFNIKLALVKKEGQFLNLLNKDIELIDLNSKQVRYSILRIIRLIHREKPDVVFSTLGYLNLILAIIKKFFPKIKFIARESSIPSTQIKNEKYPLLFRFLYRTFYNNFDLIISQSNYMKEDLVKNFKVLENKVEVIYNPCDVKEIEHLSKEQVEDVFCAGDYLINVGRLEKQKGQWHLIRIFKYLKGSFPELKLVILGEGGLKNYLVNLSEKLGMKTYVWGRDRLDYAYDVYFLGFKKNPFKYMKLAKLFLFTSLWEGFPNILVEAMACGIPVMSADCRSGPREILAPSTDVNLKTEKPEYVEFGILMPVLEEKYLDAYDKLTEKEKIWLDTLKGILKNENKINHYRDKSRQRAYDFEIQKILGKWEKLILGSVHPTVEIVK